MLSRIALGVYPAWYMRFSWVSMALKVVNYALNTSEYVGVGLADGLTKRETSRRSGLLRLPWTYDSS
jgi:hypothetical protein